MEVIVVVVEEEVAVAGEAGAAAAEAAAAAAAEAAAEAEAAVAVAMMMTMTMTMTMTMMGHLSVYQVPPTVEPDVEFSTIKKWNSNSLKSYKINARWLRDDGSLVSRPPIPSRPRIRMDDDLPSHADRRVYETKKCYEVKSTGSLDSSLTASIIYRPCLKTKEGSLIQDKATLRRVAACDGWRQVQSILNAYRETAFTDLVYMIRICAKIPPTETHYNRMDRIIIRAFKINEQLYHEHPGQFTEWLLRQIRR